MTSQNIPKELIALVLQDLPESIVFTMVVFSFLCLRLEWKKIVGVAFLQTVTNLVRLLPVAAGVPTVVLVISLSIYVRFITRERLSRVFLAVLGAFVIGGLAEFICFMPLLKMTGRSYEEVFAIPALRELYSLPGQVVLLLVALGKNYYNRRRGEFSA